MASPVGLHVGQAAPDYEYLVPAVAQIEERLAQTPEQMVVDAGYTSRQNILAVSEKAIELVGPWTEGDGRAKQRFARAGIGEGFSAGQVPLRPGFRHVLCPEGKHLTACDGQEARPGRTHGRHRARQADRGPVSSAGSAALATGATGAPSW